MLLISKHWCLKERNSFFKLWNWLNVSAIIMLWISSWSVTNIFFSQLENQRVQYSIVKKLFFTRMSLILKHWRSKEGNKSLRTNLFFKFFNCSNVSALIMVWISSWLVPNTFAFWSTWKWTLTIQHCKENLSNFFKILSSPLNSWILFSNLLKTSH